MMRHSVLKLPFLTQRLHCIFSVIIEFNFLAAWAPSRRKPMSVRGSYTQLQESTHYKKKKHYKREIHYFYEWEIHYKRAIHYKRKIHYKREKSIMIVKSITIEKSTTRGKPIIKEREREQAITRETKTSNNNKLNETSWKINQNDTWTNQIKHKIIKITNWKLNKS